MSNNAISQLQEGAGPTQSLALQGLLEHIQLVTPSLRVSSSLLTKKKNIKIFMPIHGPELHPADILIKLPVLPCNTRTVVEESIYGEKLVFENYTRDCNRFPLFSQRAEKSVTRQRLIQPNAVSESGSLKITR